jgi:hypothetical protein
MKKTPLKSKSSKGKLIAQILKLMTAQRRKETGNKCEVCGREANNLALHHILERSRCPRLIVCNENLILLCWSCHILGLHGKTHNHPSYKRVEEGIQRLRGKDYERKLLIMDKTHEKITEGYLRLLEEVYKQEA